MQNNSFTHDSSLTWPSAMGHVVGYTYHNSTSGEWSKVCVLYNNDNSPYTISNLGASSWKVVANSVSGSSISTTGANIAGIADLNSSSVTIPAKGTIVLINGFGNKSVTDSFGTLTVTHKTESGTVLKTQHAKYRTGNTYRALPDATILFSRALVNTTGSTSGTVSANGNYNVTFTYSDSAIKDGYLTINYLTGTGAAVREATRTHLKQGDSFNANAPAIQGYELDTSKYPAGTVGVFDGNDKTINFTYKALAATTTVHYNNTTGAKNIWMYAYTDTSEVFGKWDDVTKSASAKMTSESGTWMKGVIPAASSRVIFRLSGGKQEPGQGEDGYLVAGEVWINNKNVTFNSTIKTSHINLNTGEKIAPDVVTNAENATSSTAYTTAPISGRDDVIVPGNASGTVTPGVINVVYFYTGGSEEPTTEEPTTEPEPTTDNPDGVLIGAVLNGESISVSDATAIQQYLAESRTLTGDALIAADCDGDSRVSIKDVTVLQKYLAEYTTEIGNVGRRI